MAEAMGDDAAEKLQRFGSRRRLQQDAVKSNGESRPCEEVGHVRKPLPPLLSMEFENCGGGQRLQPSMHGGPNVPFCWR